jgi:dihydrolipoamide dehydrogenase
VKVVLDGKSGKILGCSAVGSEAPELIQQVVYLMNADGQDTGPLIRSQIIHPTLNEALAKAFVNLGPGSNEAGSFPSTLYEDRL